MSGSARLLPAALVAAGVALGGYFIGHGFVASRSVDRYVTVKGVAERSVSADLALWPLQFVATGDRLTSAQARIDESRARVLAFLNAHGIDSSAVELQSLDVTDLLANPYRPQTSGTQPRFIITQTLMVRSSDPAKIRDAAQKVGSLVQAGVVLGGAGGGYGRGSGPTYLFTRLNDVKPAMIAEATANAREAAQKFAADSKSRLGGIRDANQGIFVILPRDQAPGITEESQIAKTVRIVATVDYYLKD